MKTKICVYAICKNESKFVKKWLDSMQEADYIVVLDTGSTDGTPEMLAADPRVTKVESKEIVPWRFDVARNESLKLVPEDADVLVCTDLDEVFDPGWGDRVREIWGSGDWDMINYKYAWSHNEIGEPTDVFMYNKIHNRKFHWAFPVHEVLVLNDGAGDGIKQFPDSGGIFLHHYPDVSKSRRGYFDLLKISVEENPEDAHVRMLLAREFTFRGEFDEAIREYEAVLNMRDVDSPEKRLVLLESLFQLGSLYRDKKNYDEAIWYCQEFIKEDPSYREPYLLLGEMYNAMGMYSLGEAMGLAALKNGVRKYDWVERSDTWISWADDVLSVSEYGLGDIDKAIEHANACLKHHPDNPRILKNSNAFLRRKIELNERKLSRS